MTDEINLNVYLNSHFNKFDNISFILRQMVSKSKKITFIFFVLKYDIVIIIYYTVNKSMTNY